MMNDVSLIDGHIDGNNPPCKDCIQRHYNCHSECEQYNRYREQMRKRNAELSKKLSYECIARKRDIYAGLRRAKQRNERH